MSMNLHLSAGVDAVSRLGSHRIQESFDLWQTPTVVTRRALAGNPHEVYVEWVRSISRDEQQDVYAEDDFFCERVPVGTRVVNYGEVHLLELSSWLSCHEGWEIEWYEL